MQSRPTASTAPGQRPAAPEPEARLLVVEDEPNIRELLATSLRFAGFEVQVASNGRMVGHGRLRLDGPLGTGRPVRLDLSRS